MGEQVSALHSLNVDGGNRHDDSNVTITVPLILTSMKGYYLVGYTESTLSKSDMCRFLGMKSVTL